jgi:hypothetical protein
MAARFQKQQEAECGIRRVEVRDTSGRCQKDEQGEP